MFARRPRIESLERRRLLAGNPLDISFSGDGLATTDFDSFTESFTKVVAAKGTFGTRTVAAGTVGGKLLVARFMPDGSPDTSFNGTGSKIFSDIVGFPVAGLSVYPDGKVILAGTSTPGGGGNEQAVVVRLTSTGDLDHTWDNDGVLTRSLTGAQQANVAGIEVVDGAVYLAGDDNTNFVVARLTATGGPDTSYGSNALGILTFPPPAGGSRAQALDFDFAPSPTGSHLIFAGRFILATPTGGVTTSAFVTQLAFGGLFDPSFGGGDGLAEVVTPASFYASQITSDADGRIYLGGAMYQRATIARFNTLGEMDLTFGGGDGYYDHLAGPLYTVAGLTVSGDKVLFASPASTAANGSHIVALTNSGVLDTSFATNGVHAGGLATYADADVQSDGKVVFAGTLYKSGDQRDTQVARITLQDQPRGSIEGSIFDDVNGNATQDAGETLYTNYGVSAYLDLDADNAYDFGEPTAYGGNTGRFAFSGIAPGSYTVRINLLEMPDYRQTAPVGNAGRVVTVVAGQTVTAPAFGIQRVHTVRGTVFNDVNKDGTRDTATEPGIAGRTVFIDTNGNDTPDSGEPTTVTTSNGSYSFTLPPGSYLIKQALPSGWGQTGRSSLAAVGSQFNATGVVKVPDDLIHPGTPFFNFGARVLPTSRIPGSVIHDANGNGQVDNLETGVLPGDVVYIDSNNNGSLDAGERSVTTGFHGWSFDVTPGTYVLRQQVRPGFVQTMPANNAPIVVTVTDTTGPQAGFHLFGVYQTPDGPTGPDKTTSINSTTSAYVRDGSYATKNFGSDASLAVRSASSAGNTRETYVKFDLTSVPTNGTVFSAKIRIYGKLSASQNVPIGVVSTSTDWTESGITWNKRPAAGNTILARATVNSTTAKWYDLDVTAFVKNELAAGRKAVSFVIGATAKTDAQVTFNSDEASSNKPRIIVETGATSVPQAIVVSPTSINVPEGGRAPFNVSLAKAPKEPVTVYLYRIFAGDDDLREEKTAFTFTPSNWNVPQQLFIQALQDTDTTNGSYAFTLSAAGISTKVMVAYEIDDDGVVLPPAPKTIASTAASFVRDGSYAAQNFNSDPTLTLKRDGVAGNTRESYIKFDLTSVSSITSAKLRLYGRLADTRNASVGVGVYNATNTAWTETGLTWNNKPASDPTLRYSFNVTGITNQWYEVNITSFLQAEFAAGRKVVTLVLKVNGTNDAPVLLSSDEVSTGPQLVVT